jgi:hypothetical protein
MLVAADLSLFADASKLVDFSSWCFCDVDDEDDSDLIVVIDDVPMRLNSSSNLSHIRFESSIICDKVEI